MGHRATTRKVRKAVPEIGEEADVATFIRAKSLAKQWDCDVRTIKRMVLRGELKGYRRGGTIVIPRADALRYIEANAIKPRGQPKQSGPDVPPIAAAGDRPEARSFR